MHQIVMVGNKAIYRYFLFSKIENVWGGSSWLHKTLHYFFECNCDLFFRLHYNSSFMLRVSAVCMYIHMCIRMYITFVDLQPSTCMATGLVFSVRFLMLRMY